MDDERLREMWSDERFSISDICDALGALQWDVTTRARVLGLPPKATRGGPQVRQADPSPEDIERACREIQARHWTDEEREVRWVGGGCVHWSVPVVGLDELEGGAA
jgi:hypothetical protein